jgi:hypothetical protein
VTDELTHEVYPDQQPTLQRRSKRFSRVLVIVASLVLITAAGIYIGLNSRLVQAAYSSATPDAAPVVDETVTRKDFQSFQKETADLLQSAAQGIEAEKADVKILSEQVAALTAKMDALERAAAAVPAQAAVAAQPVPVAPRKKTALIKPAGPISVGGVPLPNASSKDDR